jgi:hypothetical protein
MDYVQAFEQTFVFEWLLGDYERSRSKRLILSCAGRTRLTADRLEKGLHVKCDFRELLVLYQNRSKP